MIIGNRYFIDNPESGLYEVTKQEYERYNKMMLEVWEKAKIKLDSNLVKGKIVIFGTAGELDNNNYLELFYNTNTNPYTETPRGQLQNYFTPNIKTEDL